MKKQKGFTLLELIVVMAVVSILSVLAVPSFKTSMINNRLRTETMSMSSFFNLARIEALRRNDYVSICASANGTSCGGTNYAVGALIFVDSSNSGLGVGSKIIRIKSQFTNSSDKAKGITRFTFSPTGAINSGSLLVCHPGYDSYSIVVGADGSIKNTNNLGDGSC